MPTIQTEFPHVVEVVENLFIPLPDGTRLAAKLWRPQGSGRYSAILEYLPYRKHDGTRTRAQGGRSGLALAPHQGLAPASGSGRIAGDTGGG